MFDFGSRKLKISLLIGLSIFAAEAHTAPVSVGSIHRQYDVAINGRESSLVDPTTGMTKSRLLDAFDRIEEAIVDCRKEGRGYHVHKVARAVLLAMEEDPKMAYPVGEAFLRYSEAVEEHDSSLADEIIEIVRMGNPLGENLGAAMDQIRNSGIREMVRIILHKNEKWRE